MKTLLLLRHAKSDWNSAHDSDHERPLNKRGRRAAAWMGRYLSAVDQVPDRVLSSTAQRAHDTALRASAEGGWPCEIETAHQLYEATCDTVLELVRRQGDDVERLLLVGHQPTWSELAGGLVGSAHIRFPTAALARIDIHVPRWRDVDYGRGELIWLMLPRLLEKLL